MDADPLKGNGYKTNISTNAQTETSWKIEESPKGKFPAGVSHLTIYKPPPLI